MVWQVCAMAVGEELLLPTPLAVGRALTALVPTAFFWQTISASVYRVLMGLFWGILSGILLSILTWGTKFGKYYLAPMIKVVQATPVVSFILLLLLWTKRDNVPIYVSAFMVAPIIWANTEKGFEQSDPALLEFATVYQYSKWKKFCLISVPSAFPFLVSALGNAVSLGWKSAVAAEVIALPPFSVGTKISQSKLYLETPDLFAWTAVMIVLSAVMGQLVAWGARLVGRRRYQSKSS